MGYVSVTDEVPRVPIVRRAVHGIVQSANAHRKAHRGQTRVLGLRRRRAGPVG